MSYKDLVQYITILLSKYSKMCDSSKETKEHTASEFKCLLHKCSNINRNDVENEVYLKKLIK